MQRTADVVSLQINLTEFTCPLSKQLFFWPFELSCGHMFEKQSFAKAAPKTCPVCEEKVGLRLVPGSFFSNQLEQLYAQHPSLLEEMYFWDGYVVSLIQSYDDSLKERLAAYLCLPEKLTDHIVLDLMSVEEGIKFLQNHRDILSLAKHLINNVILTENGCMTPLYCLLQMEVGIQFLNDNPELVEMITPESLSWQRDQGNAKGSNVLSVLCGSDEGIEFLIKQPTLCAKITPAALNNVILEGGEKGASPLRDLLASKKFDELREKMPEIINMIEDHALNASYEPDNVSALYLICRDRPELLVRETLRAKIRKDSFNGLQGDKFDIQTAPFICLTKTIIGRMLLVDYPDLAALIDAKALNASNAQSDQGPLYDLLHNAEGRELFLKQPHLAELIDEKVLNAADEQGESLANYLMATEEGRRLVEKNEILAKKILPLKRRHLVALPGEVSEQKALNYYPQIFTPVVVVKTQTPSSDNKTAETNCLVM